MVTVKQRQVVFGERIGRSDQIMWTLVKGIVLWEGTLFRALQRLCLAELT